MDVPITGTAHIDVTVVRSMAELAPYASPWNSFCAQNHNSLPQLSHAMACSWLEHRVKPGHEWVVLVAKRDGRPIGFLPLVIQKRACLGLKVSIGAPPQDTQIASVDMVAENGSEGAVLAAFLKCLDETFPLFSQLEMFRIAENSVSSRALHHAPKGHLLKSKSAGAAACYQITGNFDEYMNSLKPNFSRNLRRLQRKIEGMADVELASFIGQQCTDDLFERFLELEASGWKGKERGAILSSPTATAYYREVFRRLRELGWCELYTMSLDGVMIAAQFGVRLNRRVFLFKICYSEEFSNLGPGNVLMMRTIERAFQQGDTDEINCLTDMSWHNNWVVTRRPYTTYTLVPKRIAPMVANSCWTSTRLVKSAFARIF